MNYGSSKGKKFAHRVKIAPSELLLLIFLVLRRFLRWGRPSCENYAIIHLLASYIIYVFNLPLYKGSG